MKTGSVTIDGKTAKQTVPKDEADKTACTQPTVSETTLREQARVAYDAAYVAHRTCCHEAREVIYQALRTVEREALERAARACIEADETGCDTGQFYAKVVLSVSGDSTS